MDDSSTTLVKVTMRKYYKWDTESNILLYREVVAHRPQNPQQWGKVAGVITAHLKKKILELRSHIESAESTPIASWIITGTVQY